MLTGSIKGHKVGPALLSKMVDNLTFVTAYYKIYDDSDNTEYIDYFLKWADKGANVVLFLDPLYASVADIVIDVSDRDVDSIVGLLVEALDEGQMMLDGSNG